MRQKFYDNISEDIYFSIEVLTPFSDDVLRKTEGNKSFDNNDISMSMIVQLGNLKLFLGGDVENEAIERIHTEKMEDLSFIKIPHHGSNSSNKLPEQLMDIYYPQSEADEYVAEYKDEDVYDAYYEDECNNEIEDEIAGETELEQPHIISVSTCFRMGRSRDPRERVLELYKPFSERICLTDYCTPRKHHYGVWTFVYNIEDCTCVEKNERKGDAGVWYEFKNEDEPQFQL